MAQRTFRTLPGGRVTRYTASAGDNPGWSHSAPRWVRKTLRRRRRRAVREHLHHGRWDCADANEVRDAAWYW